MRLCLKQSHGESTGGEGSSTTEGPLCEPALEAGGGLIFILCLAGVSLRIKGHCCLPRHSFHISLPDRLDPPSKFSFTFDNFKEDSASSHNSVANLLYKKNNLREQAASEHFRASEFSKK